ncbi:hypothetical protein AAC387_Pa09g2312 [Persea americana]
MAKLHPLPLTPSSSIPTQTAPRWIPKRGQVLKRILRKCFSAVCGCGSASMKKAHV